MSIKKEIKKKREVIKEERYEKVYCDLCRKYINKYSYIEHVGRNIKYNDLDPEECKPVIGIVTSEFNYGDSQGCHGEVYDICEKCYNEKVKPLLETGLGLKPREVDLFE